MNANAIPDSPQARPAVRAIGAVMLPVAAATMLADSLFWRKAPGISLGIFFVIIGAMLLAFLRERPRVRVVMLAAALLACGVQAAVEFSLSNFLAGSALVAALAGEVFQPHLAGLWARFSEVLFGIATAPFRWFGFTGIFARTLGAIRAPDFSLFGKFLRMAWVVAPAAVLLLVFAGIFSSGNAIFADVLKRLGRHFMEWFDGVDLSPARFVFWILVATLALGLFHGTRAPDSPRWWTRVLPRLPRPDFRLAGWQTGAVLVAVNALFCFVNTIDVVFLWRRGRLPEGVNHTEFVHEGVWSLIAAVVVSALVIAGLFQQEERVVVKRWLKSLGHLWVAQNILLIGGVFLRLKYYVDEFQLTEKRVYVGCFLLLVCAGFVFLAWFVERRRSFNWLLGRNAWATFALFFILQFPDVGAYVARYNVAQWLSAIDRRERREIDVAYIASLGPGAWPQLRRIAAAGRDSSAAARARERLAELRATEAADAAGEDWREWQWRRVRGREVLRFPL